MIYVTVGTQLPFDRLLKAVDKWARRNPGVEIFGQIGLAAYQPTSINFSAFVSPQDSDRIMQECEFVVAHAGMGSILTALRFGKPILVLPRRAELGEHRNDHQLATARWLNGRAGLFVAWDVDELTDMLDQRHLCTGGTGISEFASSELITRLRDSIFHA